MSAKKLSKGEEKFVSAYTGSIKETAGIIKLSFQYCRKIATLPYIINKIRQREDAEREAANKPLIADRQERQEFWSSVARGEPQVVAIVQKTKGKKKQLVFDKDGAPVMEEIKAVPSMKERLRAAELLGRSNADFVDSINIRDESKGVPKEITDNMDQKEATNIYLSLLKPGNA